MQLRKVIKTSLVAITAICMLLSCKQPTSPEPEVDNSSLEKLNLVKEQLTLPSNANNADVIELKSEIEGVKITWESSNPSVIDLSGKVKALTTDTTVKLTATLKIKEHKATKDFDIKVKGFISDEQKLENAKASLVLPSETANEIVLDLKKEIGEVSITWKSDNEAINDSTGMVKASTSDTLVTLTATLTIKELSTTKKFTITVLGTSTSITATQAMDIAKTLLPTALEDDNTVLEYNKSKASTTINIQGKDVEIIPSIVTTSKNVIDKGEYYLIKRDLKDQQLDVSYTLKCENNEVTTNKSLLVPSIKEWHDTYYQDEMILTFTPTYFELSSPTRNKHIRYSYTKNDENNTLKIKSIGMYWENQYHTNEEVKNALVEQLFNMLNDTLTSLIAFENDKTFDGAQTYFNKVNQGNDFNSMIIDFFDPKIEVSQLEQQSLENKNKAAVKYFDKEKKSFFEASAFDNTKSLSEIASNPQQQKKDLENSPILKHQLFRLITERDGTVSFNINENKLSMIYLYEEGKNWYDQAIPRYKSEDATTSLTLVWSPVSQGDGVLITNINTNSPIVFTSPDKSTFRYLDNTATGKIISDLATKSLSVTVTKENSDSPLTYTLKYCEDSSIFSDLS